MIEILITSDTDDQYRPTGWKVELRTEEGFEDDSWEYTNGHEVISRVKLILGSPVAKGGE